MIEEYKNTVPKRDEHVKSMPRGQVLINGLPEWDLPLDSEKATFRLSRQNLSVLGFRHRKQEPTLNGQRLALR
jgi:hypothetical protein